MAPYPVKQEEQKQSQQPQQPPKLPIGASIIDKYNLALQRNPPVTEGTFKVPGPIYRENHRMIIDSAQNKGIQKVEKSRSKSKKDKSKKDKKDKRDKSKKDKKDKDKSKKKKKSKSKSKKRDKSSSVL